VLSIAMQRVSRRAIWSIMGVNQRTGFVWEDTKVLVLDRDGMLNRIEYVYRLVL
jgi:hypothetical protein